ncbi:MULTISPECIES: DNA cytosine methyltransferase [unclassified Chelatococcus]|jgi:DNA (cytosine-5)-methyltransferase 1|uniref:DNA cytosine methyltransferase n=1 Tax=unclassified Chelatococcus TaxID=2638111 RepID=UPI00031F7442|nr:MULTISPECIES: DNA cytosine methyltransferase [unclassified Chelatococcus]|tara:strand:+ start:26281 stop:27459 length:1179 start_codon:yes stop_codon:yes gene_type:complete
MTLRAVSLFSGAGGFCEGVRLAGWNVVCAVESDAQAWLTHAANFSDVALYKGDIVRFLQDEQPGVPGLRELTGRKIDMVYGGPPCQGFSQIGPRNLADPRNRLYEEFVRVVRLLRPRAFVMENVPNMVAMKNGHFKARILDAFREAGYSRTAILPAVASDFGVPQHRRRVFVFGIRDRLPFNGDFAEAIKSLLEREKSDAIVTVREALSDLPATVSDDDGPLPYPKKPGGRYSDFQKLMRLDWDHELLTAARKRTNLAEDILYNHHTKGIEARRKKIIAAIRPGARGDSLPAALWNGTRGHKWRRLDPEKPSYTILAQMHRDLSEWIHPTHDRWITVREAARLQSFHDGFVFHGSEWQQLKQVGNAVPPLMARAVARAVSGLLDQMPRKASG